MTDHAGAAGPAAGRTGAVVVGAGRLRPGHRARAVAHVGGRGPGDHPLRRPGHPRGRPRRPAPWRPARQRARDPRAHAHAGADADRRRGAAGDAGAGPRRDQPAGRPPPLAGGDPGARRPGRARRGSMPASTPSASSRRGATRRCAPSRSWPAAAASWPTTSRSWSRRSSSTTCRSCSGGRTTRRSAARQFVDLAERSTGSWSTRAPSTRTAAARLIGPGPGRGRGPAAGPRRGLAPPGPVARTARRRLRPSAAGARAGLGPSRARRRRPAR